MYRYTVNYRVGSVYPPILIVPYCDTAHFPFLSKAMSHPEFLRSLSNIFLQGLQGAVLLAWGMWLCPISLFSCAAVGGAKGNKSISGTLRYVETYPDTEE